MIIEPCSELKLYKNIRISGDEKIAFKTMAGQRNYFATKIGMIGDNFSYLGKEDCIQIEDRSNQISKCNYLSFTNPRHENRTIYAFITDYKYINNVTVKVWYEIDAWTTFWDEIEMDDCIISREYMSKRDNLLAIENPNRMDIVELCSPENLSVAPSLERPLGFVPTTNILPKSSETYPGQSLMNYVMLLSPVDTKMLDKAFDDAVAGCDLIWPNRELVNGNPSTYKYNFTHVNLGFVNTFMMLVWSLPISSDPTVILDKLKSIDKTTEALNRMGVLSNIIGTYILPRVMLPFTGSDPEMNVFYNDASTYLVSPPNNNVVNPKLNHFPFSYLRVISPDGVRKEYQYEKFDNIRNGSGDGIFHKKGLLKLLSNLNGMPVMSIAPWRYDYTRVVDMLSHPKVDLNIDERLDFSSFPQVAYSTDAFLTFLSNQYASSTRNNSMQQGNDRMFAATGAVGDMTMSALSMKNSMSPSSNTSFSDKGKGLTGTQTISSGNRFDESMGAASGIGGALSTLFDSAYKKGDRSIQADYFAGKRSFDSVNFNYEKVAPGYVSDNYHPGGTNGHVPYMNDRVNFIIQPVTMNDAILSQYDSYFTGYGYNSGRFGLPRIYNYMTGSTDASKLPHFNVVNGKYVTYVKTANAKVFSPMRPISAAIEQMLNDGCTFVKGD